MAIVPEVEPDLQHIHWSFPEHVATLPTRSLATSDQAMDYFALSPFFDLRSNNGGLRTQRRIELPDYGHAQEKHELKGFTSGFEYIISHAQAPDLFLIHRRDIIPGPAQSGGNLARSAPSAMYFILHDKIYPTPSLYGVMAARLRNASTLVASTFSTLLAARPAANPRATTAWRALPPSVADRGKRSAPGLGVDEGTELDEVDKVDNVGNVDIDMDADDSAHVGTTMDQPQAGPSRSQRRDTRQDRTGTSAETKEQVSAVPDWHLFHALQSTTAAMDDLNARSGAAARVDDPRDELRRIEAEIMGGVGGGVGGGARTGVGSRPGLGQGQGNVQMGLRGGMRGTGLGLGNDVVMGGSVGSPSVRMVSSPVVSLR